MASLEKQPEPIEPGPAEQAGVFISRELNGSLVHMPRDLGSTVLLGIIPPLSELADPITGVSPITRAQKKFGKLDVKATPGGPTQIFTQESDYDDHAEREAQRIREEIDKLHAAPDQPDS